MALTPPRSPLSFPDGCPAFPLHLYISHDTCPFLQFITTSPSKLSPLCHTLCVLTCLKWIGSHSTFVDWLESKQSYLLSTGYWAQHTVGIQSPLPTHRAGQVVTPRGRALSSAKASHKRSRSPLPTQWGQNHWGPDWCFWPTGFPAVELEGDCCCPFLWFQNALGRRNC